MNEILTQLVIPLIGAFVIGLVVGYMFFRAGRSAADKADPSVDSLHQDLLKKSGEADAYKTRAAEFRALLSKRDAMVAERDHYLAELEGRLRATEAELVSQRMSNSGNHSIVSVDTTNPVGARTLSAAVLEEERISERGDVSAMLVSEEVLLEDPATAAAGVSSQRDTDGFIDLREEAADEFDWDEDESPVGGQRGLTDAENQAEAAADELFEGVSSRLDPPLPRPAMRASGSAPHSGGARSGAHVADRPSSTAPAANRGSAPVGHSTAEHPHVPTAPVVGPISPAVNDEVDPADVTLESPVDTAWLLRKQTERRQVGEPASIAEAESRRAPADTRRAESVEPPSPSPSRPTVPARGNTPTGPADSADDSFGGGVALLEAPDRNEDADGLPYEPVRLLPVQDEAASEDASSAGRPDDAFDEDDDPQAADVTAERLFVAEFDESDDLVQIVGIGPKINSMLHERGITTYRQVAQLTQAQQEELDEALGAFRGRIERQGWVSQAYRLHQEKYDRSL